MGISRRFPRLALALAAIAMLGAGSAAQAQGRIFWPDANGNLIPVPNGGTLVATSAPPYLARDRYLSYTMAAVTGQEVSYQGAIDHVTGYHQFYAPPLSREVINRKPRVTNGADSIVFLRGRYRVDETSATPVSVTGSPLFSPRPPALNSCPNRVW